MILWNSAENVIEQTILNFHGPINLQFVTDSNIFQKSNDLSSDIVTTDTPAKL